MARFRDRLTASARAKYLLWRALPWRSATVVELADGRRVVLSSQDPIDLGVAYEIFVAENYRSPRRLAEPVRRIVDVGANVGNSVLYWARRYPNACIEAIEPHPRHVKLLRRTVALNRLTERVNIHEFAAGTGDGVALLADEGVASTLFGAQQAGLQVPVVDFFSFWGDEAIDLLKLDCEGAEYNLVMDPRFERVRAKALVLEWHETAEHPRAREDITGRLEGLGWQLEVGPETRHDRPVCGWLRAVGLIWAYRERLPVVKNFWPA